nr:MAG TPA: hypothetical protein [Caudoviricetes sp.]
MQRAEGNHKVKAAPVSWNCAAYCVATATPYNRARP